jgi:predicted RND superfamily exporter protein
VPSGGKESKSKKWVKALPPLFWTLLAAFSCFLLFRFVDLKPQVEPQFFFAKGDPHYREDLKIKEIFPELEQVIVSAQGPLREPDYLGKLTRLTRDLASFPTVFAVNSLVLGPEEVDDAYTSPLWKRVLLSKDRKASLILLWMKLPPTESFLLRLEEITNYFHSEDFQLRISGASYVIELIRRYLLRDLQVFTLATFLVFVVVVIGIFRSFRLLLGTIVSCLLAGSATLFITNALKIPMGPLTANLTTMIFVMTLGHASYLTFNWKHVVDGSLQGNGHPAWAAVKITLPPSFWSMFTTFLGFASLMFVQATPMQRLGVSGSLGTGIAFLVFYLVYPWFLRWKTPHFKPKEKPIPREGKVSQFLSAGHPALTLVIFIVVGLAGVGFLTLQHDPSFLSYFKPGTLLREDLDFMDHHWGTGAIKVVIEDQEGGKFTSRKTDKKLWKLQEALETYEPVGYAVTLAPIVAEARETTFFSFLFRTESILRVLDQPKHGEITRQFVTGDRKQSLVLLHMKSESRPEPRFQIIEQIKQIVEEQGFSPVMIGGIYLLQGKLSELIYASLVSGIISLLLIFLGIGIWITRSLFSALALTLSLAVIPAFLLGALGHLRIPIDMISAPASNLAIGMGVDAMIHTLMRVRRLRQRGRKTSEAWTEARKLLWKAVLSANAIVCLGFAVFVLSQFPPTQRFGMAVILGTTVSVISTLFVLPTLAELTLRREKAI